MRNERKPHTHRWCARLIMLTATSLLAATPAFAGPGCDINLRINNNDSKEHLSLAMGFIFSSQACNW